MKPWVIAVGLSIALHLGLVVVFYAEEVPGVVAQPVAKAGERVVSFTPVTVPEVPNVEPQRKVAKPAATVHPERSRAATESALVPEEGASSDLVEVAASSPVVEVAPVGTEGVSPHPDPPSPSVPSREEGDVVAMVHARLAAVADRCYPAAARRFQQRGTVQVSFCTDASGAAASTSVTQSSGAELLDAAARGCVIEAAAPFPPEAAGRCFSVPVRFGAR